MAFLISGTNDKNVKSLYSIKTYPLNQAEFVINMDSFDSPLLNVSLKTVTMNFDSNKLNDKPMMVFSGNRSGALEAWDGSLNYININFKNDCSFTMNIVFIQFSCYLLESSSGYIVSTVDSRSGIGDVAPNETVDNFSLCFMMKGIPYSAHMFSLNTTMVFSVV